MKNKITQSAEKITLNRVGFEQRKKCLSKIYIEWYKTIQSNLSESPGINLELGSGAGFIKELIPNTITSDVVKTRNIDINLDAFDISKRYNNEISNLILVNTFHHIPDSITFIQAASQALVHGGRIVMIEPWNNPWSRLCYRLIGHEPFDPHQKEWFFHSTDPLLDSNQAQAWIVFERDREKFHKEFPNLHVRSIRPLMPFAYTLTGGHSTPLGLPSSCIGLVRKLERKLLDRRWGMFASIVIEKA